MMVSYTLQVLAPLFDKFDVDRDKSLDAVELMTLMNTYFVQHQDPKHAQVFSQQSPLAAVLSACRM